MNLSEGFEWCRKGKYNVQIERGFYIIDDEHPLLDGFEEELVEIDGVSKRCAVKKGTNILEQNSWVTSESRPFIVTGTMGERWVVKPSNLSAYDVDPNMIGVEPIVVSTKDPSEQEFLVAFRIPETENTCVVPKWAFQNDGSIDKTQIMIANSKDAVVPHNGGDYIVAKHVEGQPEYMELSEEQRNTELVATLYDPRIVNGSIMQTTYDCALTQEEIKDKYGEMSL